MLNFVLILGVNNIAKAKVMNEALRRMQTMEQNSGKWWNDHMKVGQIRGREKTGQHWTDDDVKQKVNKK